MKILDFITLSSMIKEDFPRGMEKFVVDQDCEILPLEIGEYLAICDIEKIGINYLGEGHFAMCIVVHGDIKVLKAADTREELVSLYTYLVSKNIIKPNSFSKMLKDKIDQGIRDYETLGRNLKK